MQMLQIQIQINMPCAELHDAMTVLRFHDKPWPTGLTEELMHEIDAEVHGLQQRFYEGLGF